MNNKTILNQDYGVLKTRLHRPQLSDTLLPRPDLFKLLDFNPPKALTQVIAPAGFGKTTLVSARLDEMQCSDKNFKPDCLPSAWLAIDEKDQNLTIFLRYFVATLREVFPEGLPETHKLIYSNSNIDVESVSLVLTNEIAQLSQRFVMVLDDFQRNKCPQFLELLSRWVKHWPLPMHLVIISRTQPSLPLAGLKCQGRINDIRSKDLRFSPRETEDFIRLTTTSDPTEKTITDLLNHIEGWAAGLKFTAIALNKTSLDQDIESVVDLNKQDIISYLADEVFNQMTEALQRFLIKISILDVFSNSLCLAIIDQKDQDDEVTSLLENMSNSDFFITALHGKADWFKMHHIMRGMLQNRLVNNYKPSDIKELHLRASSWYAGHNLLEPALEHAKKADNSKLLAEILDRAIFAALEREDHILIIHLMQSVSEDMIKINPQFLLYKAWLNLYKWDFVGIKNIIDQAEKIIKSEKHLILEKQDSLFGQLAFFKGFLAHVMSNYKDAFKLCTKALDVLPTSWTHARANTVLYLGRSIQFLEGTQKAAAFLQQSYQELDNRNDNFAIIHLFALSTIFLHSGDLRSSEHYARLLLDKARENNILRKEGFALILLGSINYQWNKLDLAEQWYQKAYKLCPLITPLQNKLVYFGLALALRARGNFIEALAVNQELTDIELELTGQITDLTQVNRLRILISQNQWKEVEQWADAYSKPFADGLLIPDLEDPLIFKARVLIAREDPKDLPIIMEILSQYIEITSKTDNNRCKAEALALSTLAESNAGNKKAARDLLIESLIIASRGNMIRLYIDLGSQMEELLKQIAPVAEVAEFVQDLLDAFAQNNAEHLTPNQTAKSLPGFYQEGMELSFYEKLTLREKEVLALMAEAISLQEIADRLFISYATAKRHTVNIYSKLGVHSRWESVSFARKNGII